MKALFTISFVFLFFALSMAQEKVSTDCNLIQENDCPSGDVRVYTDTHLGNLVWKETKSGETKYYLCLNVLDSSAVKKPKGAIALLANGDVIERLNAPVTFDANSGGNKFRYNSIIELTASELKLLKEFPIILIHLHTFDSDELRLDKLMEQVKCLDL